MARPTIEPITEAVLPEFAAFLAVHLNAAFSAQVWEAGLRKQWTADLPNYGFVLRDEGRMVGGIGAYYADRHINGALERFCNITSWCVLEPYRQQSMRLAMAIIQQPGFHFTDFSPTKVVAASLQFLKFKPLDEGQWIMPNMPLPSGGKVLDQATDIQSALAGEALAVYRDHAEFPWLKHLAVGEAGAWCHVIYKPMRYRGLPGAQILHFSDAGLFERHLGHLRAYFLVRGLWFTQVECRKLDRQPWFSKRRSGFNPKMFLSHSLEAKDIDYLYSESVALDL